MLDGERVSVVTGMSVVTAASGVVKGVPVVPPLFLFPLLPLFLPWPLPIGGLPPPTPVAVWMEHNNLLKGHVPP